MDTTTVTVKFQGPIAKKAGLNETKLLIHCDREHGMEDIKKLIMEKAGDQMLYIILINGKSAELYMESSFSEEDEFSIVPIVLGG